MPRWEPDARERIVRAALDLFTERGYDATTVGEIASAAGLSSSTFFRHFPEKKDVLAAGQDTLVKLLSTGITEAAQSLTILEAVAEGLARASTAFTSEKRDLGARVQAVIATNSELQDRNALKQVGMAAAMAQALQGRGVAETSAVIAGELGVLALKRALAQWSPSADVSDLARLTREALLELHEAAAALT